MALSTSTPHLPVNSSTPSGRQDSKLNLLAPRLPPATTPTRNPPDAPPNTQKGPREPLRPPLLRQGVEPCSIAILQVVEDGHTSSFWKALS